MKNKSVACCVHKRPYKKWTKQEEELLIKLADTLTSIEIGRKLGRSPESVTQKLSCFRKKGKACGTRRNLISAHSLYYMLTGSKTTPIASENFAATTKLPRYDDEEFKSESAYSRIDCMWQWLKKHPEIRLVNFEWRRADPAPDWVYERKLRQIEAENSGALTPPTKGVIYKMNTINSYNWRD